jgi:hypothetical protein
VKPPQDGASGLLGPPERLTQSLPTPLTLPPVADVSGDLLSRVSRAIDAVYDGDLDFAVGVLEDALIDLGPSR